MHSQNRPPTIPRAGFTLLELVGVMAVIAILAAAVLPGAIDLIRTQRAVKEGEVLPKIAEALKRGMLREQIFPIYENDADELTEGNDAYWWNLAARHGGGSANELRYPLGIRPGSGVTRKLYFAKESWSGKVFSQVTGDGLGWLNNFQDPTELRLLLVSTTNPDLLLPDTLNEPRFNKFWEDWAVGNDGDPASGAWSNYGFSSSDWQGRAAELNVQRIDLRDWLCTVTMEVRRRVNLSNLGINPFNPTEVEETSDLRRVVLKNASGASVYVTRSTNTSGSSANYTIESVVIDGAPIAEIEFDPNNEVYSELPNRPQLVLLSGSIEKDVINLTLEDRNETLPGFDNNSSVIQSRYFLLNETIFLKNDVPVNPAVVGEFIITESFSTLRFDGLEWHY
jgi:prepilin-type N-terminal cleavage/methylation domain-containing protein